jgi:hypothetical protein
MKEFQHKKKIHNITHSRYVLFALIFFTFILLTSIFDLFQKKRQVVKFQKESRIELQKIREKSELIEKEVNVLDTAYGQERLIREKYNVKTPGEGVIIVTDVETQGGGVKVVKRDFWYTITHLFDGLLGK